MLIKSNRLRFPVLPGIFFFIICVFAGQCTTKGSAYEDFSGCDLIRFHIRAESNAKADQEAKMQVRQKVLEYIRENAGQISHKSELRKFVLRHRPELEQVIKEEWKERGAEPFVSIYFTKEFFPMRKYGRVVVPAGIYEALRIDLGKAEGRNWWCVLYPDLCLIDSEHVLENPDDKERLNQMLQKKQPKVRYKSYVIEYIGKWYRKQQ